MSRDNKDLVVGLDIGTSKIVALVAEITPEGRLNVIGMGSQDSRGLKKGVVVNIEETVHTISRVIQEVELMADCKVRDVYTGIAGSHIKSFNSNGMVAIKDKEVTASDVDRVIETARAMPIPADQEILHILTQEFVIDGQDGIREPIGMSGMRLEPSAIRGQIASAVGMIIQIMRLSDGTRKMMSVSEIVGMEGNVVQMQDIFVFHRIATDADGKVQGEFRATGLRPKCLDEMIRRGIHYDTSNFDPGKAL